MLNKILYFLKYNNLTVLLVSAIFLAGAGVFAQTPTGEELIGMEQKRIEGVDNTLLLEANLDSFKMDFKIEKIEEDAKYYYVTYTFLNLTNRDNAWQYSVQEKIKKVSKKLREDLGIYLANQFKQEYEAKIKDLKIEKERAEELGSQTRTEVVDYSGLIGQTFDLAGKIFPGYEPEKKYEIPSPAIPPEILQLSSNEIQPMEDNLEDVYREYIANNDIPVPDNPQITEPEPEASTSTLSIEPTVEEEVEASEDADINEEKNPDENNESEIEIIEIIETPAE